MCVGVGGGGGGGIFDVSLSSQEVHNSHWWLMAWNTLGLQFYRTTAESIGNLNLGLVKSTVSCWRGNDACCHGYCFDAHR